MNTRLLIFVGAIAVSSLAALTDSASAQQTVVRHVDGDIGTSGNGLAWNSAFKHLQDALAWADAYVLANPFDTVELWVAATEPSNPYLPDRDALQPNGSCDPPPCDPVCICDDELRSFELLNQVQILGGFAGGETSKTERDPAVNVTVLSGDLAQDDDGSELTR